MIDGKQPENVDYFNYLDSIVTKDARCTYEIKSRISTAKATFNKKRALFARNLDVNLRNKLLMCYIWNIYWYSAETWRFLKVDQKHLKRFVIMHWRGMEICLADRVRNEVLQGVKEERNILHTINRWKANWIGHIWRRDYLPKQVYEGKVDGRIEVTGRRGRRCKQLLDDFKREKRILEFERGSTTSLFVENGLWERLWTYFKTQ